MIFNAGVMKLVNIQDLKSCALVACRFKSGLPYQFREYIMSLLNVIRNDLDTARRNKDTRLLTLLTTLYSEAAMVGKTKRNGESSNEEVLAVTKKFKVGVEEIIKIKGSNEFLDFELSVYEKYLPEMLTVAQLTEIINTLIAQLPEKSPKAMGVIMGKLKTEYLGRYDGTVASKLVKDLLV